MVEYRVWYGKVRTFFVHHPFCLFCLRFYNRWFSILLAVMYAFLLFLTRLGPAASYFWLPASGFLFLSRVRKQLNSPRPYELYPTTPLVVREGSGESMPSRHVFSATILSMVFLQVSTGLGLLFLLLSLGLALVRVFLGVHFLKDVVVGYLLGLVWGSIFYLL